VSAGLRRVGEFQWAIEGTPVFLWGEHGDWTVGISSLDRSSNISQWATDNDLYDVRFRTRALAERAVRAALAVDPLPELVAVDVRRHAGGWWRSTDGRYVFERVELNDRLGWRVRDVRDGGYELTATLFDARLLAAAGKLMADDRIRTTSAAREKLACAPK